MNTVLIASSPESFIASAIPAAAGSGSAQDAVRLEPGCGQMLAAPDAPNDPVRLAHHLRQQAHRIPRPGEVVAMAAVVAEDVVARPQVLDDRNAVGLLTDTGMRGAVQHALVEQRQQCLFEAPDEAHAAIETHVAQIIRRADQPWVGVWAHLRIGPDGRRSTDPGCRRGNRGDGKLGWALGHGDSFVGTAKGLGRTGIIRADATLGNHAS